MLIAPTPTMSGNIVEIANGTAGIYQTLAAMRRMVNACKTDFTIRQAATSTVFLTPEKDELAEIRAIFEFVRDRIRYVKDIYGVETLSTPDKTLEGMIGDCDDQTTLLAAMLEAIGYPTRFVIAGYSGSDFEHVYLQVWVQGHWIGLDPTEQHPMGWEPPDPTVIAYEQV